MFRAMTKPPFPTLSTPNSQAKDAVLSSSTLMLNDAIEHCNHFALKITEQKLKVNVLWVQARNISHFISHYSKSGTIHITLPRKDRNRIGWFFCNFTWSFSGDVPIVGWGIKRALYNHLVNNGWLVSLGKAGSPYPISVLPAYTGRVSGKRGGNSSSGQAIFTLRNIRKTDERFYGCVLRSSNPWVSPEFDAVHLFVAGG